MGNFLKEIFHIEGEGRNFMHFNAHSKGVKRPDPIWELSSAHSKYVVET